MMGWWAWQLSSFPGTGADPKLLGKLATTQEMESNKSIFFKNEDKVASAPIEVLHNCGLS